MNDYVRKMASVQEVAEVKAIPEADKICAYKINGWWVVDQVGKYQVGDKVVYAEADSWIPTTLAPFLSKGKEPRVFNGVPGEKLRTIRLKKQVSQGLLLPMSALTNYGADLEVGADVSEVLNIQKWEAPPEFTSADSKGSFPSFIIKTDQERIQNCYADVAPLFDTTTWEETEKCEGSSMTVYHNRGEFGVCSRNLNLRENEDNTFWKVALENDMRNKLAWAFETQEVNLAVQGELCGPGIQDNIYGLTKHMFFVFDIFDIDKFEYVDPDVRRAWTKVLGLTDAPVYGTKVSLAGKSCADLLLEADGISVLGMTDTLREGKVYKANIAGKRVSFKVVSDMYLLSKKD